MRDFTPPPPARIVTDIRDPKALGSHAVVLDSNGEAWQLIIDGTVRFWCSFSYSTRHKTDSLWKMSGARSGQLVIVFEGKDAPTASEDDVYDLVPWDILEEHRLNYDLAMLKVEARRRAGTVRRPSDLERLDAWPAKLHDLNAVVHYDPESGHGFHLLPREAGDADLIRAPVRDADAGADSEAHG